MPMVQIVKDFFTKSGERKVHFNMSDRKEKIIAQEDHVFLAFLVMENYSIDRRLNIEAAERAEALKSLDFGSPNDQTETDIKDYYTGAQPKYDYNALFTRGLPGFEGSEKLKEFPFYAQVLSSMSRARVRDIKRGKLINTLFTCRTIPHYKPIEGMEQLCSEEYAAEFSADTFRVNMESFADPSGHVALTDNLRVMINRATSEEVKKLGWEFDYVEYTDVEIDHPLYDALIEVFPETYELAKQIGQIIYASAMGEEAIAPENIYRGTEVEKIFNRNTAHVFEDAVGFNENEMMATIDSGDAFTNFIPTEEELAFERDKYFMEKIREYIVETDKLRDEYLETEEVDRCARAMYEWYLNIKARC